MLMKFKLASATALTTLATLLAVPVTAVAFGSHGDQRASVGPTFTYLSRLEMATGYVVDFLGSANPVTHPLADRDYVALNLKYRF